MPLFRNNDGSNCENADISTLEKRRLEFSLLLTRGVIRIGIDVPPGAEFTIESVDDPYNCGALTTGASMYRRPLPATNLGFLSAVMWDGRESSPTTTILADLAQQADDATTGHAQASLHLTTQQAGEIVTFETGLFTAQARDDQAGTLSAEGAYGGPVALSRQPFFIGINDPVGLNPAGTTFDQSAFTLFTSWGHLDHDEQNQGNHDERDRARQSIARGEVLFNTKPITISGVAGLNDQTFASGVTVPSSFTGNCTICHDTPNVGNHSVKAPLNIGRTDPSRRTPDMPLYTLRNLTTGETVQTTDPGRAMITGSGLTSASSRERSCVGWLLVLRTSTTGRPRRSETSSTSTTRASTSASPLRKSGSRRLPQRAVGALGPVRQTRSSAWQNAPPATRSLRGSRRLRGVIARWPAACVLVRSSHADF